jgi:TetR/AcrR family transcriptional regulator
MVRITLAEHRVQSSRDPDPVHPEPACPGFATEDDTIAPRTRIQTENRVRILDAALDAFSAQGFRGATLDQIARAAGLSKPNLLYYFPSKEAMHLALIEALMDTWLDPLRKLDPDGDPIDEIVGYVLRKLDLARDYPRESRLFANEIVQGAPNILPQITGPLKALVDDKARLIADWSRAGHLPDLDPHHLIFSIWATTQHYADFDAQIRGILTPTDVSHFDAARVFLGDFYRRALTPR